jgi:hypothetical protein
MELIRYFCTAIPLEATMLDIIVGTNQNSLPSVPLKAYITVFTNTSNEAFNYHKYYDKVLQIVEALSLIKISFQTNLCINMQPLS